MTSPDLDLLKDLILEQGRKLDVQGQTLATISQETRDLKERLFGVGNTPGALPYMNERIGSLEKEVGKVKSDRRADHAWAAGASAVIALSGKWLLGKFGIHF